MRDAAASADGQPADEHGENQNEQRAKREIRNGEPEQGEEANGVVSGFSTTLRCEQARWNSNGAANDERGEGEFERCGIMFKNDVKYGLLKAKRFAEIATHNSAEIAAILNGDRLIESQGVPKLN